jgi:hypothetical protein
LTEESGADGFFRTHRDHGFITDEIDFMEKRIQLQQELEQYTPIPEDDLERAADLLKNFKTHWEACGDDVEAQARPMKLIVKRVYILDEEIVAMTLRSDYHVVLGHKLNGPTEVSVDPFVYTHGSDGDRTLACIRPLVFIAQAVTAQGLEVIRAA